MPLAFLERSFGWTGAGVMAGVGAGVTGGGGGTAELNGAAAELKGCGWTFSGEAPSACEKSILALRH